MKLVCPICGRTVEGSSDELRWRPFCSSRCRKIDLGKWLGGDYRFSEAVDEAELDEGASSVPVPTDTEKKPN